MRPIDLLLSCLCGSAFAVRLVFARPSPPVGRRPLSITPTFTRTVHFRFVVSRKANPHRVRFRMCRKSRGRRIRTSREARSSSGLIAAYPFPPRPETRFSENVWAGATPALFSPRASGEKWGRSRPLQCITRVQTARRAVRNLYVPNNFASPLGDFKGHGDGYVCLSRTRHLSAPGNASKPFPRISIRNGFTRPTGDINVNSPYLLRGPRGRKSSRRIFLICHPRLWVADL